jgi:8-oxo-dGTP pyrophosphatase MutT (NUDIX family)
MTEIWKPNVTVAAVIQREGYYLLIEEQTSDGLRLNQPAGHLEPGESLVAAAIRETLEETTRAFTPEGLLGVYMARSGATSTSKENGANVTYMRFAFVGSVSEPIEGWILDTGIVRSVWMSLAEIRATVDRHRSPLVLLCAEDHASGRELLPLAAIHVDPSAIYPT